MIRVEEVRIRNPEGDVQPDRIAGSLQRRRQLERVVLRRGGPRGRQRNGKKED
jgi:hypothetical protein